MYQIESLRLLKRGKLIREEMHFTVGANLIVDTTPIISDEEYIKTGNSVGKTTVLKVIDFLLGASRTVFVKKESQTITNNFLLDNNVSFSATFADGDNVVVLERGFDSKGKVYNKVDGEKTKNVEEYITKLSTVFFDGMINTHTAPSLRQLMARVMRYGSKSVEETFKYLNDATSSRVYESIYLYLFGYQTSNSQSVKELDSELAIEMGFQNKLKSELDLNQLLAQEKVLQIRVSELKKMQDSILENPEYEASLREAVEIKANLSTVNQRISNINIKNSLLNKQRVDLSNEPALATEEELKELYIDAERLVGSLPRKFSELVEFVSKMRIKRLEFAMENLSENERILDVLTHQRDSLVVKLENLEEMIGHDYATLPDVIRSYATEVEKLARVQERLRQLREVSNRISSLKTKLDLSDQTIYSPEVKQQIDLTLADFSEHYLNKVFKKLYGDDSEAIVYSSIGQNQKTKAKFYTFGINDSIQADSPGTKQAITVAFDIAYLLFARKHNINTPNFVVTDRKELVDLRQIRALVKFANDNDIQLILPILNDKISQDVKQQSNIVVSLNQDDKLFRIESK